MRPAPLPLLAASEAPAEHGGLPQRPRAAGGEAGAWALGFVPRDPTPQGGAGDVRSTAVKPGAQPLPLYSAAVRGRKRS